MENQKEIISSTELLNDNGRLNQEGWARHPYWHYDRRKIRAPWFRIKEWDYYYVLSEKLNKGITFTFSDPGYAGLMAVCWLDFDKSTANQVDTITLLPRGPLTSAPEDPLEFSAPDLDLSGEILLEQAPGDQVYTASGVRAIHLNGCS